MTDDEKNLRASENRENTGQADEISAVEPGAGEYAAVPVDTGLQAVVPAVPVDETGGHGSVREEPHANKNLLEMIYGVLFDPVETFRGVAASPPIGRVLLIFSVVSVLAAVMGYYLSSRVFRGELYSDTGPLAGMVDAMIPLMVFGGLIIAFVKWIAYSGLLHLVAEMFGGSGRALGVLAVTGLATIPVILLMPFDLVVVLAGGQTPLTTIITGLFGLVSLVWGFVLVVLGLREVHGFSTGRALAVALAPPLAIIVLMFIFVLGMIGIFASMPAIFDESLTY
ncbi:MAG: hypothetical protein VR69_06625 [Peptococcaceae bacterium BRH_c4b]|nr:MAG: hypothetical protein VR69_06625 [Peptococcaceae bacterium BRH_c4b]